MTNSLILGKVDISYLIKASKKLDQILEMEKNEVTRDAAIQRFEFNYELAWKTTKKILLAKGITANNPRDVFREAAKQQIINSPEIWFKYIEYRNLTSHVYNESVADEIYAQLPKFNEMLQHLISVFESME